MRQFGLIGNPLGHSFSASYFEKKFMEEGIDACYSNFPLESLSDFESLLKREPELSGLNVTVPYKQQIIPYLDSLSETAGAIEAVNTISLRRDKDGLVLTGDNTDVVGFRRSLEEHLEAHHNSALVLGTGGSSKAVVHVLEELGIGINLVSRSSGKNRITYEELDSRVVGKTTLIVNTSPLGMYPEVETYPQIPYQFITDRHLLFDLVYNPEKTEFLLRGEKQGARIVNGFDMLVYQAEKSWEIWNS